MKVDPKEEARGACPLRAHGSAEEPIGHPGAACADPDCLFRAALTRERVDLPSVFAEYLRERAEEARQALRSRQESKADYVQREAERPAPAEPHWCHFPDCPERVAPVYLMCPRHWQLVPTPHRREVWRHFRPGQERDKAPSADYLAAAREAIDAAVMAERKLRAALAPSPQLKLF